MKIGIITGASSGLGREFALNAAKMYADLDELWLIARRKERLEALANEVNAIGCMAVPIALDICAVDAVSTIENMLINGKGKISLLINNAGVGSLGNVAEMPVDSQTKMIDLNVKALTALTTMALKYMERGAEIINVCSIAAFAPNTRLTVYSSTKAYVLSYTKGLREELKSLGINCCCVCPGPMKTEFLDIANITGSGSKAFAMLPYCDANDVAKKAIKASKKHKCVYTNKLFYKFYRLVAKLLPHGIVMKMSKT